MTKILAAIAFKIRLYFKKTVHFINRVPVEFWFIFVVIFAIGIRFVFPIKLAYWDDFDYSRIAKTIEEGRFLPQNYKNWFAHRYPVVYPVAFAIKFLGTSEWALLSWPFFCSIASVIFTFIAARELFGKMAAFWAGLLMAIHPMEVKLASVLLPAPVFNFLILGGITFWILGEKYRPHYPHRLFRFFLPDIGKRDIELKTNPFAIYRYGLWFFFWFLAGAFWVSTYYLRPYGLLIFMVPAMYMAIRWIIKWEYIWLPVLAVIFFLIIEVLIRGMTKEWFFNYSFLQWFMDKDMYPIGNVTEHLDFYRNLLFSDRLLNMFTILLLVLIGIYFKDYKSLIRKQKAALWIPLIMFMLLFGYLEFGVFSIEHLSFLFKEDRYIGVINPAVCMILGLVFSRKTPDTSAPFVIAGLIFLAVVWISAAGWPQGLIEIWETLK